MLASPGDLPTGAGWAFEFKWDGVRALAVIRGGQTRLYARSGSEITKAYPELAGLADELARDGVTDAILDGEIVLLDDRGRPSFALLAERMHVREPGRAKTLSASHPVTYMIFDVLAANGTDICAVDYLRRRVWLESLTPGVGGHWLVPPRFDEGAATVRAAGDLALEGVVAKKLTSSYRPGLRSPDWVKIKHEPTGDYVIGAWRAGRRKLGAVLVGSRTQQGRLRYRGRVGGGVSAATERELLELLAPLAVPGSPFDQPLPADDARGAHFVQPVVVVEVRYGQLTPDGKLRFPRLVRLRPDKTPEETADE